MRWLVGDVQGCAREFERLLAEIRFDPDRDELWCLGDLVNRGPDSLGVLRLWQGVGGRAILGNHEIKILLRAAKGATSRPRSLAQILAAPDGEELLEVLQALPVLVSLPSAGDGPDAWIVHAGLHPDWVDLETVARDLNAPPHDAARLESLAVHFATNVRCCDESGAMADHSGPPEECPEGYRPWDELHRGETLVVHGHWAARGHYRTERVMGLDSACVYGGALTAWCQDEDRIVQVPARSSGGVARG